MRYIRIFSELSGQIKYSSQKRILIEVALIKLCKPQMENKYDSLIDRVGIIERKLEQGDFSVKTKSENTAGQEIAITRPPVPKAIPEDVQEVVKNWKSILSSMSGLTRNYFKLAHLSLGGDNRLMVVFDDPVAAGMMGDEVHRRELEDIIAERIGKQVEVAISANESGRPFEESYVDLNKIINMDIIFEDE